MSALAVLPEFEQVLDEEESALDLGRVLSAACLTDMDHLLQIGVVMDEGADEEGVLDIGLRGHAHQEFSNPALWAGYHLALWVSECAVRYCRADCSSCPAVSSPGIFTSSRSFCNKFGN